jgi:cholesterol transport system auxiliary component
MTKRWVLLLAAMLAACASPGPTAPVAQYDFGIPASPVPRQTPPVGLSIPRVSAPEWLDTPALDYRLAYEDAARVHSYANSRWVAPPAQLLTERLRHAAAEAGTRGALRDPDAVKTEFTLRVELEEFSQVFDTPEASRAVLRARASLVAGEGRTLVAQRSFLLERPAPTPNAEGGVRALTACAEELVGALLEWIAQALKDAPRQGAAR